jgi:DNA-binding SARP family transcriptional activator
MLERTTTIDAGSTPVRLRLLGGFSLVVDGNEVNLPLAAERLVAFLALSKRSLRRHQLASMLWMDAPEDRALANVRSALWRLRQLPRDVVVTAGRSVSVTSEIWLDVDEAVAVAERAMDPSSGKMGRVDYGLLCRDLLPEYIDDWVVIERERLRQVLIHGLEATSGRLLAEGMIAEAIEAALAACLAEPLRESAHRALIAAFIAEGNASEAIRQYEVYRDLLGSALGLPPSGRMEDLMRQCAGAGSWPEDAAHQAALG